MKTYSKQNKFHSNKMNPEIKRPSRRESRKSRADQDDAADQNVIIKFMKGQVFSQIIDKAVEKRSEELLEKVYKLEENIQLLTSFNKDVIKLLSVGKEVATKHKHTSIEKPDLKDIDLTFYNKFIKKCHDETQKSVLIKGSHPSLHVIEDKAKIVKRNIVPINEIKRFVIDCFLKVGLQNEKAKLFANALISADCRGIFSHGLNRLEKYLDGIKAKNYNENVDPTIISESESAAVVNGNNGLGCVIGMFCMNLAMKKAEKTGIGMVVANGSNNFGYTSFYTEYAVEHGYIGLAFTNNSPMMVPTGAKMPCLGTNPLSIAAPAVNSDKLVIDFATTTVAMGKIEMSKKYNLKIPFGWAFDELGNPTNDPEAAMKAKRLTPLGGRENHKGTGLGIMVEILSSLLSNALYGPNVHVWDEKPYKPANLGHGFIVIDPRKFTPGFEKRLGDLLVNMRKLEPIDPTRPIRAPGDLERGKMEQIIEQGGIEYTDSHLQIFQKLVKDLGVKPPMFKP